MKTYLRLLGIELAVIALLALLGCEASDPAAATRQPIQPTEASAMPPTVPASIQTDMQAINANATSQAEYQNMQAARGAATGTAVSLARQATEVSIRAAQTAAASQARATEAASAAQVISAQATANANATVQSLLVIATRQHLAEQATIAAQQSAATATANAQNVAGTATANAQRVAATATKQVAQVTEQAAIAYASQTQTAYDRQVAESARAQSATATSASASATATSVAVSALGTMTAQAVSAQATQVSVNATATVIHERTLSEQNQANVDRQMEWVRVGFGFVGVMIAAVIALIGLARVLDAVILRLRTLRDPVRGLAIVGERDRNGRNMVIVPDRSPGPVIVMVPNDEHGWSVETPSADRDTTARAQTVSLMLAARAGGDELLDDLLGEDNRIAELDDAQAANLLPTDTDRMLEARWKELNYDAGS